MYSDEETYYFNIFLLATGEPPLCMSVVVIFALRHALESARKDAGLSDQWFDLGNLIIKKISLRKFLMK